MSVQASIATPSVVTSIVRVGRQVLLVPEAIVLVLLIGLYYSHAAHLSLAILALCVTIWFALRMGLLMTARGAFDAGHYARAEALAYWAVSLYPYSADALTILGAAQLADGQVGPAIANLQRATLYYPGHAGMYTALATGLLAADRTEAARTTAEQALILDPTYGPAYVPLAEAETRLGASDATIEALLRRGLELPLPPGDAAALHCALAGYLVRREAADEAHTRIKVATALLADAPVILRAGIHFQLGEVWRTLGDVETARIHFAASAELDPQGPHAATAWRAART
jgi:tetratricopeptide (TPR) repeat protein